MDINQYTSVFFAATFFPIIFFSVVAILQGSRESRSDGQLEVSNELSTDDYLIANRQANEGTFVNSSTAYMLQVSTTFYFVYWGYNYGLSNIWYIVAWAAGIIYFSSFAEKLYELRKDYETLPSFISNGSQSKLRSIASLTSMFAFLGVFYVEAFFTADFVNLLSSKAEATSGSAYWWFIFIFISILTLLYSSLGGIRKVFATDQYQLAFSYFGFACIFAYLISMTLERSWVDGLLIAGLVVSAYALLAFSELKYKEGSMKFIFILASIALIVMAAVNTLSHHGFVSGSVTIQHIFKQVLEPWGAVTLLGFTILNVLWQFCDNSNFQRIASLELPETREQAVAKIKRNIRALYLVSPITWGMGILLGMAIRSSGFVPDAVGSEYLGTLSFLRDNALNGDIYALMAVCALSIALISIMMSTADTAFVSFMHTYIRDLSRGKSISVGYLFTFALAALLAIIGLGIVQQQFSTTNIFRVMAGAYSWLVVLSIPMIFKMKGLNFSDHTLITAVICGLLGSIAATFGTFPQIHINALLVLPIFAGVGGVLLIFLLATIYGWFRKKV